MSRVHITSRRHVFQSERVGTRRSVQFLEVAVSYHQGRDGIEIMINSPFGDGTRSWVMIMNGINKYVTEMSEETQENQIDDYGDSTGKLVAKVRPKQTPSSTSSSPTITLPYHQRQWIDIEPGKFGKNPIEVSKQMTRLLRHGQTVLRAED